MNHKMEIAKEFVQTVDSVAMVLGEVTACCVALLLMIALTPPFVLMFMVLTPVALMIILARRLANCFPPYETPTGLDEVLV